MDTGHGGQGVGAHNLAARDEATEALLMGEGVARAHGPTRSGGGSGGVIS